MPNKKDKTIEAHTHHSSQETSSRFIFFINHLNVPVLIVNLTSKNRPMVSFYTDKVVIPTRVLNPRRDKKTIQTKFAEPLQHSLCSTGKTIVNYYTIKFLSYRIAVSSN